MTGRTRSDSATIAALHAGVAAHRRPPRTCLCAPCPSPARRPIRATCPPPPSSTARAPGWRRSPCTTRRRPCRRRAWACAQEANQHRARMNPDPDLDRRRFRRALVDHCRLCCSNQVRGEASHPGSMMRCLVAEKVGVRP